METFLKVGKYTFQSRECCGSHCAYVRLTDRGEYSTPLAQAHVDNSRWGNSKNGSQEEKDAQYAGRLAAMKKLVGMMIESTGVTHITEAFGAQVINEWIKANASADLTVSAIPTHVPFPVDAPAQLPKPKAKRVVTNWKGRPRNDKGQFLSKEELAQAEKQLA